MNASSLAPGQKIELNDGRVAIVRFVGNTSFQTGDWVGVELDEATGKNDGSVKGERYFQCQQGHGMFLRPSGVRRVVEDVKPKTKPAAGPAGKARPSSVYGAANGLKRASMVGGSPTPGARGAISGIRSPVKSPTKQLGTNGATSSASTSRTSTPPVSKKPTTTTAPKARPSLAPPSTSTSRRTSTVPTAPVTSSTRAPRSSLAAPAAGLRGTTSRAPPSKPPASRAAPSSSSNQRLSSTTEEETADEGSERPDVLSPKGSEVSSQPEQTETNGTNDDEDDTIRPNFAPPPVPPDPPSPTNTRSRRPSSPTAASIHSQRTIRSTAASNRQIEELETKVRILERKRLEDRDVRNTLEKAQHERDQYKNIIEKLQTKYKPQQQEISELRQALKASEDKVADVDAIREECNTSIEMATLDREMAEESAENLKAELDMLREHNEAIQLELDIMREENSELTKEMTPEERENAGVVQLQMSNDRLRNALLALRDRSLDEKAEFEQQIKSLEEQVKDLDGLRTEHDDTRAKLLQGEANLEDLRQQLEAALEAEEMIEQLTERNAQLDSVNTELRDAIDDLENLKELNDELEINHVEAEKQMQEEIEFKDSLLHDRDTMARDLQQRLDDRNVVIDQFRAFVTGLQNDMADMKASKEITESEAKKMEGDSRALHDFNLKLQNSAAKTQVKTIDLELRKLEAQEASEHLAIVQLFLPEAFSADHDSVLALLRFKRISFKANLVQSFVKERVAAFRPRGMDEEIFAACDVLDKLTWIAAMAERFVNSICTCSVEEFARYEFALYEVETVERALNNYIDGVRREDLKERTMAEELQRSIAVMSHLATLHIQEGLASHADDLLMRTQCLQSQLESAATALQLSRGMIEAHISKADDDDEDDDEEGSATDLAIILTRADTLVNHARSAKVMAGKTHRGLEDLKARSLTLEMSHADAFESTEAITSEICSYTRQAGDALLALFGEEGRPEPFSASEVGDALSRTAVSMFSLQTPEAGPYTSLASRLRDLTDVITELASLPTDLDNTVEFERGTAPWVARANELKATKTTTVDTEAELARTVEVLRGKETVLRDKERELEEQGVKIETLEARLKAASKRTAEIAELEQNLRAAKDAERKARREAERAREEKDRDVERVREELSRAGAATKTRNAGDLDADAMGSAARMTIKRQGHKIASLEGAIRYLKEENSRLHLPPADAPLSAQWALSWLNQPLSRPKTEAQKRKEELHKEGKDLLRQMLALASERQVVDLSKMPENKLAWRPAKESGRWRFEKRREEWEGWREWRRGIIEEGTKVG